MEADAKANQQVAAQEPEWKYEGPADIHDAKILSVEDTGDTVVATLEAYGKRRRFSLTFHGVRERRFVEPEGMLLYSLSTQQFAGLKRYVLTNWHEEDDAYFSVLAERFDVTDH